MKNLISTLILGCFLCFTYASQAQILKKAKGSLKKEGNSLLKSFGKKEAPVQETKAKEKPVESGGKKLKPPDVKKNIDDAANAYDSKDYGQSRFAIEQAMMGIEIEIGDQILALMPEEIDGIPYEEQEDEVTSSGMGFVGFLAGRKYYGADRYVEASVLGNSAYVGNAQMIVSNPSMASLDENEKIVVVQGNKALLQYDEYSGFKLTVPLGQSSAFSLNCTNFESEDAVMEASDLFDLAEFKELLGEK